MVQTGPFKVYNNWDSDAKCNVKRIYRLGDLFEVDTLPTGVGTGEYFHLAMLQVNACVIGDKGTDAELL